jgi:hypothetical protein
MADVLADMAMAIARYGTARGRTKVSRTASVSRCEAFRISAFGSLKPRCGGLRFVSTRGGGLCNLSPFLLCLIF